MAWTLAARGALGPWASQQGRGNELMLAGRAPCQRGSSSHYGPGSSPWPPQPSASGLPSSACCGKAGGTGLAGGKRGSFDGFRDQPKA